MLYSKNKWYFIDILWILGWIYSGREGIGIRFSKNWNWKRLHVYAKNNNNNKQVNHSDWLSWEGTSFPKNKEIKMNCHDLLDWPEREMPDYMWLRSSNSALKSVPIKNHYRNKYVFPITNTIKAPAVYDAKINIHMTDIHWCSLPHTGMLLTPTGSELGCYQ